MSTSLCACRVSAITRHPAGQPESWQVIAHGATLRPSLSSRCKWVATRAPAPCLHATRLEGIPARRSRKAMAPSAWIHRSVPEAALMRPPLGGWPSSSISCRSLGCRCQNQPWRHGPQLSKEGRPLLPARRHTPSRHPRARPVDGRVRRCGRADRESAQRPSTAEPPWRRVDDCRATARRPVRRFACPSPAQRAASWPAPPS